MRLAEQAPTQFNLEQIFTTLRGVQRIGVAVSGGSDSMALLRLLQDAQFDQAKFFVLTVDHGLRPEAAAEASQVNLWCDEMCVPHTVLRWVGDKPKTGIQAKARSARYDLMTDWCRANDVPVLLTGHTADDQAETVAMRMTRTASLKSLAGIWPARDWNGVALQRPLLGLRREDLRNYLRGVGQHWIDDPSNDDKRYERVRVRHNLVGNPAILLAKAKHALDTVQAAMNSAADWWTAEMQIHQLGFATWPRGAFGQLEHGAQDEVLIRLLRMVGGGGVAELAERSRLLAWLNADGGSRRALGGVVFAKRATHVLAGREPGRIAAEPAVIPAAGRLVWDKRFEVLGPAGVLVAPVGYKFGDVRRRDIPAFVQAGLPREEAGVSYKFITD